MKTNRLPILGFAILPLIWASAAGPGAVPLSSLDLSVLRQGWGQPVTNGSVTGGSIVIAGQTFAEGVGTHARSVLWIELDGGGGRFQAAVGVDDATTSASASVEFVIGLDHRQVWESGVMRRGDSPRPVDVDLTGARTLLLLVTDAGDGVSFDHADWAEARFVGVASTPRTVRVPKEEEVILTPPAGLAPRINGPTITGCRPGNPFLYRVPTTGERPIRFAADGLPAGVRLDADTGIMTGAVGEAGETRVIVRARNRHGRASRELTIRCGEQLALTPPMGWNHWYAHYDRITDRMMREAAEVMVRTGMADVGYQYVSIDDCWMNAPQNEDPLRVGPLRDDRGNLVPNRHFPDMRALTEAIHGLGLKAGIYTSPGPFTCAGFAGSYEHEAQDARQFADWGFDLLKYDWCSYGQVVTGDASLEALQEPYRLMGALLREQSRDIVLNLCQYGMGEVWRWGAEVGGHSWRTSGDLGFELDRIFEVARQNAQYGEYNGPGHWNDPDYLQIGYVGAAHGMGLPRPCPLSPSEQYAFMSLWCLMASPLFYSGDLEHLDAFTLNVLCNPEVIAVNQDRLGECARVLPGSGETFCLVKTMADGSRAVGMFNAGELPAVLTLTWADLGISGVQRARDLWRQLDVGGYDGAITRTVPRRSGVLLQLRGSAE